MNLRQMRYIVELDKQDFNLTTVSRVLNVSQPGISRQIQMLEAELATALLIRHGKRILGLTPAGKTVLRSATRIVSETIGIKKFSAENRKNAQRQLRLATTHFHARYTLLDAIVQFRASHPDVKFSLHQRDSEEIADLVASEKFDLGISGAEVSEHKNIVTIPCQKVERALIVPRNHPLLKIKKITLEKLSTFPMIVYDRKFSGGARVLESFSKANLEPNIVMTATDVDVIKAYVSAGIGVSIIQKRAFDPVRDVNVRAIDVGHIFRPGSTALILPSHTYVNDIIHAFINYVVPDFSLRSLKTAIDI